VVASDDQDAVAWADAVISQPRSGCLDHELDIRKVKFVAFACDEDGMVRVTPCTLVPHCCEGGIALRPTGGEVALHAPSDLADGFAHGEVVFRQFRDACVSGGVAHRCADVTHGCSCLAQHRNLRGRRSDRPPGCRQKTPDSGLVAIDHVPNGAAERSPIDRDSAMTIDLRKRIQEHAPVVEGCSDRGWCQPNTVPLPWSDHDRGVVVGRVGIVDQQQVGRAIEGCGFGQDPCTSRVAFEHRRQVR